MKTESIIELNIPGDTNNQTCSSLYFFWGAQERNMAVIYVIFTSNTEQSYSRTNISVRAGSAIMTHSLQV